MSVDLLVEDTFLGIRKLRFQCYSRQLKWNKFITTFFAESANYVSNTTVDSLIGIKSLLFLNDRDDFF